MPGAPQVLKLLEEMLESGRTPDEVCRNCPELLPEVRERWKAFCVIDAEVKAFILEPETRPDTDVMAFEPIPDGLPRVTGYELEAVIGQGGMGVVYKARHLALKRTVALKMIAATHSTSAERTRFRTEAEAVARLQHPNIVQIFEIGEMAGAPFIALEFVPGGSLAARLAKQTLRPRDGARVVATLAEAMHLAHSRNLVHRDLKPDNVLLAGDAKAPISQCQPKVTDFGLARQLDADSSRTRVGVVMGTPSYMAPEQAEGRAHAAGPAADVYALGAILYKCVTGRPPFEGATPLETLEQVRTREPATPSSLNRLVPRDLDTICLKCLRKQPEQRYSSALDLAYDLGRFLRGEPVVARPTGAAERLRKWMRRRPAAAGLSVAVVLLVSAGVVGVWLLSQQRTLARFRQARTDQEVRAIIQKAQTKLEAGWDAHDLAMLTEAQIEADQAEGVAHNGGASAEVRQEAETSQAGASEQSERARKNRQLMDAVLEISTVENLSKHKIEGRFKDKLADDQFADAFLRWGLNVDRAPDAEVIARLRDQPGVVVQELIAALDNWSLVRRRERPSADWSRLNGFAYQLDQNALRRRLRGLLVGRSTLRPEALASAVGAASPWQALWELKRADARAQLEGILRETDPGAELPFTVVLLADVCKVMGLPSRAESLLRQALTARPDHVVLITRLAKLLQEQGPSRYGEAIGYYRAARALRPYTNRSLCLALWTMGRYEEMEEFSREMIRQQPDDREYHRTLCMALISLEKFGPLEVASRKLIELEPEMALAHNALGVALAGQRHFAEAEKAYRKALVLDPDDDPWIYNNLGMVLVELGKFEEASAAYHKGLKIQEDLQLIYINLAPLLMRQRHFDEALATYRKAVALGPDAVAYAGLGACLLNHFQDDEGAESAYREAIAIRPNYWLANYSLGYALLRQGKHAEAADHLRHSLLQQPNDVFMTRLLCFALVGLGRGQEAQLAWRQMLEAHPADHQACNGYPELCLFLGQEKEYRSVCTAYLERFATSTDPAIAYKTARACLLLSSGDVELSKASALAVAASASRNRENESDHSDIEFTKGLADYRRGRLDSAIAVMEKEGPKIWGPAPDLVVAMARHRQGRTADARKAFVRAMLASDWSVAGSDNSDAWIYHTLRREAEALILPTLPAFLRGTYEPKQDDERQALLAARLVSCEIQGLFGSAARSYSDFFLAEPKLAEAVAKGNRFYAARMAALAGCAKGNDANHLDDKERALRRRQALEWLRQDLAKWSEMFEHQDSQATNLVRERLRDWEADFDLACVRLKDELNRLPAEEHLQWDKFWSDVDALLRRAKALE